MNNLKLKKWFVSSFLLVLSLMQISQVTKATNSSDVANIAQAANADGVHVKAKDSDVASQQQQNDTEKEKAEKIERFRNFLINTEFASYEGSHSPDAAQAPKPFDPAPFRADAEKLYTAMTKIVNDTGRSQENLENFPNEMLKIITSSGTITYKNRAEFDNNVNSNANFVHLFKGLSSMEQVKQFLSEENFQDLFAGLLNFGKYYANRRGTTMGCGIYATTNLDTARHFATQLDNNSKNEALGLKWRSVKSGAVVDLGFDKTKVKLIDFDKLLCIKKTLIYYHPEIGNFFECFDRVYNYEDDSWFRGHCNYHDKLFEEAFKKTFGFDLKDLAFSLNSNYRNLKGEERVNFNCKMHILVYRLVETFPDFRNEFDKLMQQSDVKPYITDKYMALCNDEGILARLLGYDVLVRGDLNGKDGCNCLIVNPGILTVCNELDEKKLDQYEPTLENLKKSFSKKNKNFDE